MMKLVKNMRQSPNENGRSNGSQADNPVTGKVVAENSPRVDRFRTRTIVTEKNGKKVVYKCASTQQAIPFLKLIVERERKNVSYLKDHFEVLCGTLRDSYIEYDYLPYTVLQDLILQQMSNGDIQGANGFLAEYVRKITAFATIDMVPTQFLTTIADDRKGNIPALRCLSRGLLDLTPRNILVNGSRWIVIDNEWSFDFPVPMIFLLFRAIRELAMGLQREIRMCTSVSNPAVGIFARCLQTYYVPKDWAKHITTDEITLGRLLCWEMEFQRYIAGRCCDTVGRIKRYPRTRVHFSSKDMGADAGMLADTAQLLKRIPGMRKLAHLLERKASYLRK
jgi:hypothetical protein